MSFFDSLGRERKKIAMLTQDMQDLASHSKKRRPDGAVLRMQNTKLAGEVRNKVAQAAVEFAQSKAVSEELATCRVESEHSRWSAHSVANGASKVEDDAYNAHKAVSGEVTNATKRKVSIITLELKNALKQLSTQTKIES